MAGSQVRQWQGGGWEGGVERSFKVGVARTEGWGGQGRTFRGGCGFPLCRWVHEMRPTAGGDVLTAADGPLWSLPSPATLSAPRLLTSRAQEPLAIGHGRVLGLQPAVWVDELLSREDHLTLGLSELLQELSRPRCKQHVVAVARVGGSRSRAEVSRGSRRHLLPCHPWETDLPYYLRPGLQCFHPTLGRKMVPTPAPSSCLKHGSPDLGSPFAPLLTTNGNGLFWAHRPPKTIDRAIPPSSPISCNGLILEYSIFLLRGPAQQAPSHLPVYEENDQVLLVRVLLQSFLQQPNLQPSASRRPFLPTPVLPQAQCL